MSPEPHYTPRRPWEPLQDHEWAALRPYLLQRTTGGRRIADERRRIEAFFWIAATGKRWKDLPPQFGRPDTVHRHFRRLTRAGLWEKLLHALANPATAWPLEPLKPWILRAFRRASRIIGDMKAIVLARSLGFLSALKAPAPLMPDPAMSEKYRGWIARVVEPFLDRPHDLPIHLLGLLGKLLSFAAGRRRLTPVWNW